MGRKPTLQRLPGARRDIDQPEKHLPLADRLPFPHQNIAHDAALEVVHRFAVLLQNDDARANCRTIQWRFDRPHTEPNKEQQNQQQAAERSA